MGEVIRDHYWSLYILAAWTLLLWSNRTILRIK